MEHFDDKTCLERTPLPVKTPMEKFEQIMDEKTSIRRMVHELKERENKLRKELGLPPNIASITEYLFV